MGTNVVEAAVLSHKNLEETMPLTNRSALNRFFSQYGRASSDQALPDREMQRPRLATLGAKESDAIRGTLA
jgi:hypothetical protein